MSNKKDPANVLMEDRWQEIKQNAWKCRAQKNYEVRYYNLMHSSARSIYYNISVLDSFMDRCIDKAQRVRMPEPDDYYTD